MNNNIKYLVEDYFTNTEQLTNTMKNTTKAQKKYEKEKFGYGSCFSWIYRWHKPFDLYAKGP